jgi:hypothetical protein
MGGVVRAIVSPLSIIDKDLGRLSLQVVAIAGNFIPGGQPFAAAAALALATLYKPKGPKPEQQERSVKTTLPPRVSAYGKVRLYGAYILYVTSEDGYAVDAWAFHDGQINAIDRIYLGDKQVTLNGGGFVLPQADGEFGDGDTIQVGTRLGLPTETAFSEVISRLAGIWTANHRGDGVVTGCMISKPVKAKNYNEVYPTGGPDANAMSLVVEAQLVYDWRDSAQDVNDSGTWAYSDNAALCIAHYYLRHGNKDWDTHFAPTISFWTAFADDCDVDMPLKDGGTEKRYRVALAYKHTDPHKTTLGNLLACCDGFVAPRADGALVAFSGRYIEPDPDDLIGPEEIVSYTWDDGIVDEDQINEIAVSYLSEDHDFNVVDATAWTDDDAISAAGEEKPTTLENSVPSHAQARRLAKRLLDKTMAPYRGSITTNAKGRKIRGKRFIPLHIEEAGTVFYSGPAEIVRLKRTQTGVTFDWVRANPNIDAWNPATEEGDPAPVGARPSVEPLATPTITDAEAELGDGGSSARIRITVDGFDREDVTWYARWRVTTDTTWNEQEYSDIDPGPSAVLVTNLVPLDVSIDVEVAYGVGDGRISPWSTLVSVSTSTAALAPSPPFGVSATGGTGEATVNWTNSASANLSFSRVFRNTSNTLTGATQVGGDMASAPGAAQSYTDTGLAAGTYYFWVRHYSASGAASGAVGTGAVTVA